MIARRSILMACIILMTLVRAAAGQNQEVILPVIVNSDIREPVHYLTSIQFLSFANTTTEVALVAYTDQGTPAEIFGFPTSTVPQTSQLTVLVQAGGTEQVFITVGSLESRLRPTVTGWIRVLYTGTTLFRATANVAVSSPAWSYAVSSRDIVTSVQVDAVKPSKQFLAFADQYSVNGGVVRVSAYSIVNPSNTSPADVKVSLDNWGAGNFRRSVRQKNLKIRPQGRVSLFLSELFPEIVTQPCQVCIPEPVIARSNGSLRITSDVPVAVGAIDVVLPEGKLESVIVASQ